MILVRFQSADGRKERLINMDLVERIEYDGEFSHFMIGDRAVMKVLGSLGDIEAAISSARFPGHSDYGA